MQGSRQVAEVGAKIALPDRPKSRAELSKAASLDISLNTSAAIQCNAMPNAYLASKSKLRLRAVCRTIDKQP